MDLLRPRANILRRRSAGPPLDGRSLLMATGGLLAGAFVGGLLRRSASRPAADEAAGTPPPAQAAGRRAKQAEGVLALSVLTDSAAEHFRGNYTNRMMYLPPASAAAALADALGPAQGSRTSAATAIAVGGSGLGFHAYNVLKRPGGLSWHNLFYAAPLGAPGSLLLSGVFGLLARRIAGASDRRHAHAGNGRLLAFATAAGILGTLGEVWLLHFRGAYQNPAMYTPIAAMPLAAATLLLAAVMPRRGTIRLSRSLLMANAAVGVAGTGFHVYGVSRNMGGWRNWSQNLFAGPPIPAPFGYAGVTLAGLGALDLLERPSTGGTGRVQ